MDDDAIRAMKRRARIMSRTSSSTHQQLLDQFAREAGYAHWGACLESRENAPEKGYVLQTPRPAPGGWRSDMLERATGARTSPLDEMLTGTVGRVASAVAGNSYLPSAAAAVVASLLAAWLMCRCGPDPSYGAIDVLLMVSAALLAVPLHRMSYLSPDRKGLRVIRRSIVTSCVISTTFMFIFVMPDVLGAPGGVSGFMLLGPVGSIAAWAILLLPMLIGTYAGRRSSKRRSRGMPR